MAGPAEEQDEFAAYRDRRRQSGQPEAGAETDEFSAYKAARGRKGKQPKMSRLQASDISSRQGARFGLGDEAQGMRTLFNLPMMGNHPVDVFTDVGLGLGALVMEGQKGKDKAPPDLPANYVYGRDTHRNALAEAREDHPLTSFASEVGGSVVYPAGALKLGAPLVQQSVKLGAIGAGQGALYGYSSANGDTEDRADAAKWGAVFGGGIGAAMPSVAAAGLPAFRAGKQGVADFADWLVGRFGGTGTAGQSNAERVAVAAVQRSMERSGMTPERVMEALEKFGDKPAVLAEVIGQDAVNALTALTRRPGTTPQKAQAIIEERYGGFVDRAQGDLEKATGFKRDEFSRGVDSPAIKSAIDERQAAASPIYDQVYEQFPVIESARLKTLTASPILQKYMKSAQKGLASEAAVQGKTPEQMSQLQFWDLVKRELDDAIDTAKRNKATEEIRKLTVLNTALVRELDELTDGAFAMARELGGEAPRLRTAFQDGDQALGSRNNAAGVQAQVDELNPQDAPFFKAGMAGNIATRIDRGMGPNRFRVRETQDKVRAGLGDEEGGSFLHAMEAEASLRDTGARWAPRMNSVTGTVLESGPSQLGDDMLRAATAAARGDKIGLITQAVNFMRRQGYNQRQIDAMGDLLLSNPVEGLRRLGVKLPDDFTPGGGAGGAVSGRGFEPSREIPRNALAEDTPSPNPYFGRRAFSGNESGVIGAELASTLGGGAAGGAGGYMAPAENEEQRQFNALMGTGLGLGLGIQGARMIDDIALRGVPKQIRRAESMSTSITPEEIAMILGTEAKGRARAVGARDIPDRPADPEYQAARKQAALTPEEIAMLLARDADDDITGMAFDITKPRTQVRKREYGNARFEDERLTPSQNKAVEMRRNGYTVREIADEMDTSEDVVRHHFEAATKRGVDIGTLAKDNTTLDILALTEQGLEPRIIAQRLGIDRKQVNVMLSQARARIRKAGKEIPEWLLPTRGGRPVVSGASIPTSVGDAAVSGLVGTGSGSVMGSQYDLNGDGRIDGQDMFLGSMIGGAAFLGGPQAWRAGRNALADVATSGKPMGFGGGRKVPPMKEPLELTDADRVIELGPSQNVDEIARSGTPAQRVQMHSELLRQAERQSIDAFDAAIARLENDSTLRRAELHEILLAYTGDTSRNLSRKEIIGRLRMAFDYRWKLQHRSGAIRNALAE